MTVRPVRSSDSAPARSTTCLTTPTTPGARTGVGVVVPCDMAMDRELWRWAPDDVDLYVTRLASTPTEITVDTVARMGDADLVAGSVAALVPVQPAATLYACTSGSFVHGRAGEQALVRAMTRAGAARAVTTSGALLEAVHHLGVASVAVATPYDSEVTTRLAAFLAEDGINVVGGSNLGMRHDISAVPYEVTAQLVRDADRDAAEAIIVSCTNLPTYDLICDLERELGKPVVTANQASMWAVLAVAGRRAHGPGQRLLDVAPRTETPDGAGA